MGNEVICPCRVGEHRPSKVADASDAVASPGIDAARDRSPRVLRRAAVAATAAPPPPPAFQPAVSLNPNAFGEPGAPTSYRGSVSKDPGAFEELLVDLENSASAVVTVYRNGLDDPEAPEELMRRASEVLRRVHLQIRGLERLRTRRQSRVATSEADMWVSMHMGIRQRFQSFGQIGRKVQVESRIVKHWRHQTVLSKQGTSPNIVCAPFGAALRYDMDDWCSYDVFQHDRDCQSPLVGVFTSIWQSRTFSLLCKTQRAKAVDFMSALESLYQQNPYHNRMHAADVTLAAYFLWTQLARQEHMSNYFTELDLLALILAAACHDVAHPGLTNDFLIKTRHALALRYNDKSVLENFHSATAFELMKDRGIHILDHNLPSPPLGALRLRVIEMILATDMVHHKRLLEDMTAEIDKHDKVQDVDKLVLEKLLLHVSDIGHPLRPLPLHREWSRRISDEMFSMGDREKELGLQPIALFDRAKAPSLPRGQVGFLNFVVRPAWSSLSRILGPGAEEPDRCFEANLAAWEADVREEEAEKDLLALTP